MHHPPQLEPKHAHESAVPKRAEGEDMVALGLAGAGADEGQGPADEPWRVLRPRCLAR